MLIVTGVLIALVLVVMVGNTVRTLQGVGWLSITPDRHRVPALDGHLARHLPDRRDPRRAGAGAFAFVVGSYFAAEWWRKRRVRATLAAYEDEPEPEPVPEERASSSGDRPRFHRVPLNGTGAWAPEPTSHPESTQLSRHPLTHLAR